MAGVLVFYCLTPTSAAWAEGELVRAIAARDKFLADNGNAKRAAWLALIAEFERAADVQPRSDHAARARYLAADMALRSFNKFAQMPDARKAADLAGRSVKACPRCSDAPSAYVVLGLALIALDQKEEAYRELMKVELNYQAPAQAKQARELMNELSGRPRSSGSSNKGPDKPSGSAGEASGGKTGSTAPTTSQPAKGSGSAARPPAPTKTTIPPSAPPKQRTAPKAPSPRADGRAQIFGLYLDDQGGYSEITAYLDQVTPYVYNLLPPSREGGRFRVYVDFRGTRLGPGGVRTPTKFTELVKTLKVNQLNDDTVRMVADLPAAHPYTPVFLDNPPRMIIRVARDPASLPPMEAEDPPSVRTPPTPKPPKKSPPKTPPAKGPTDSMARQLGLSIRRVAIDAGHGGKDGGAAGNGLKEKDITLKAARMLRTKIQNRLGLEVVMTRDSDVFVTLDRRAKTTNDKKADVFISIHVNANDLAKVEGFESYVLNFSNDPTAMAVAARENASAGKTMSEMEGLIQKIARNTRIAESRVLAKSIHSGAIASLRQKYKIRDLGVKEAAFVVLANVDVPAVLVEMGFITNKVDAARLSEDAYLEMVTDGLCDGLKSYLDGLP
jgi:N-acetylmuramoyl-L-alanine amidase